jgi:hypothetical protein
MVFNRLGEADVIEADALTPGMCQCQRTFMSMSAVYGAELAQT